MKTRILLAGVLVAAISTFTVTSARAQEQPEVKIIPASEKDVIKVIYGYEANATIEVKFIDADNVVFSDKVKAKNFDHGFMRKYDIGKFDSRDLWIEVSSPELTVTYKLMPGDNGRWLAHLEKATYNYAVVAAR